MDDAARWCLNNNDMKDYHLKATGQTPAGAPAFVQRAMTWAKATNEITGVIRGLLADGVLAESEAAYLRAWIRDRPELLQDSLVVSLARRIERIFEDGIVTPEELHEVKQLLTDFAPSENLPTQLPLDQPAPIIVIANNSFCFTGTFICGKRSWCEDQITTRGGTIRDLPQSYPNFLIIGSKVSGAWRNQTYGKKIEAAVAAKQQGGRLSIINEEHWLKFLS